ncbi:hypothetical protein DLAC_08533 [Tieghemostelium lacteum]|uniref:DUF4050 domain-containing protein n=1 Tax=Tieghemostelium lacteum TaxID=361077 RepID=A0A151Z7M0_TIELA|nr:hypothetical protein DLAC_08533 [Tieghemostelium lacteum]|eukprot:KYQ89963.1 hypothetical protein DLAC_08533 [Tieghemostelium lacteum]
MSSSNTSNNVNTGLENWKRINAKWREAMNTTQTTSTDSTDNNNNNINRYPSVDGLVITEEFLNKGGAFTKRVPLPDLVSILAEEWETEDN